MTYRIPSIEEFVPGFRFEVGSPMSYVVPDGQGGLLTLREWIEWEPGVVPRKYDPNEKVTREEGKFTIHTTGALMNFFTHRPESYYQSLIDRQLVRVLAE